MHGDHRPSTSEMISVGSGNQYWSKVLFLPTTLLASQKLHQSTDILTAGLTNSCGIETPRLLAPISGPAPQQEAG